MVCTADEAINWLLSQQGMITTLELIYDVPGEWETEPPVCGVRTRLFNGSLCEITFSDRFASSTQLQCTSTRKLLIGSPTIEDTVEAIDWEFVLLTKLSHLYFPFSWRKHAFDVARIKQVAIVTTMKDVIEECNDPSAAKTYYQYKLQENFRRWKHVCKTDTTKVLIYPGQLDESLLLVKFGSQPVLHKLIAPTLQTKKRCSLPTISVAIDWAQFDTLSNSHKVLCVYEVRFRGAFLTIQVLTFVPIRLSWPWRIDFTSTTLTILT